MLSARVATARAATWKTAAESPGDLVIYVGDREGGGLRRGERRRERPRLEGAVHRRGALLLISITEGTEPHTFVRPPPTGRRLRHRRRRRDGQIAHTSDRRNATEPPPVTVDRGVRHRIPSPRRHHVDRVARALLEAHRAAGAAVLSKRIALALPSLMTAPDGHAPRQAAVALVAVAARQTAARPKSASASREARHHLVERRASLVPLERACTRSRRRRSGTRRRSSARTTR